MKWQAYGQAMRESYRQHRKRERAQGTWAKDRYDYRTGQANQPGRNLAARHQTDYTTQLYKYHDADLEYTMNVYVGVENTGGYQNHAAEPDYTEQCLQCYEFAFKHRLVLRCRRSISGDKECRRDHPILPAPRLQGSALPGLRGRQQNQLLPRPLRLPPRARKDTQPKKGDIADATQDYMQYHDTHSDCIQGTYQYLHAPR